MKSFCRKVMMSSSQCIVPNWNLRQQQQQRQEGEEGEERNRRSSHSHSHVQSHLSQNQNQNQNPLTHSHSYAVPMNNKDVMELTWHNGQLALNELESLNPAMGVGDHTLESIVHQATATNFNTPNNYQQQASMPVGNSGSGRRMHADEQIGKRVRSEAAVEESACGSASAAFCRETDTTMMTWNSFESPRSFKCARTGGDDDSLSLYQDCSENQEGERDTKGESCRSQSSARRSRAAAIHNLSERRRRDRINEKMKALQKLVPNASKTDKASMLDEVIEYLKQLQAQVHMMSNARNNNIMPQMVMPNLGMQQQQLQMSLLARMGMGMGMSMGMGMTNLPPPFMRPANAAPFVSPPPFPMPPIVPSKPTPDASAAPNFNNAYSTFLAQQSMNMEFLNKMSAIYRQQSNQQPSKKPVSLSLPNDAQGG